MNTCTSLWNAMQQQIQLSRNITWNALRMHIFRSSLNIESVVKCCDCVLHDVLCLFSLTALRLCVFFFSHLPFGFVCIRLCWYAMYDDDDAAAAAITCRCCKLCLHEYECVSCVVSFFTLSLSSISFRGRFVPFVCLQRVFCIFIVIFAVAWIFSLMLRILFPIPFSCVFIGRS